LVGEFIFILGRFWSVVVWGKNILQNYFAIWPSAGKNLISVNQVHLGEQNSSRPSKTLVSIVTE